MILRGAGGGDVPAIAAADLAMVEDHRRCAVDEIDPAGNEAVVKVLAIGVDQKRVLPAGNLAIVKDAPIPFDAQRHGLAVVARGVTNGEVSRQELVAEDN